MGITSEYLFGLLIGGGEGWTCLALSVLWAPEAALELSPGLHSPAGDVYDLCPRAPKAFRLFTELGRCKTCPYTFNLTLPLPLHVTSLRRIWSIPTTWRPV